jgi:hypothetical protein
MNDTEFRPTHVAPLDGLPTWAGPDPSEPSAWLDALLPVQVVDRQGDWAHVLCANGWAAWADGRLLIALPDGPPGTSKPLTRTSDPRPLLASLERAVATYRQLVEQLAEGAIGLETFRRRSASLRLGVVIDGESAWLLDLDHDRWWYCEGTRLQTFATVEPPRDVQPEASSAQDHDHDSEPERDDVTAAPPPVSASASPTQVGDG